MDKNIISWYIDTCEKHGGLVKCADVAQMLGVSRSYITQLCNDGTLTTVNQPHLGKFIPVDELTKFIAKNVH